MAVTLPAYRYPDGRWPNTLALVVVLLGWPLGIWLLGQPAWWLNVAGVALTTLALTWSAYLLHEFAHQTIFRRAEDNERWGILMTWIHGSCFAPFADLRRKHMRHHTERADVITFDARAFLRRHPWLCRIVLALEWAYIPAVEFLMRGFVIALPFVDARRRHGRRRVLLIGAVRLAFWAAIGWWSLKALLLYALAYLLFVHLLRFADCFQHTYESYPILDGEVVVSDQIRDRAYEQANTYSDVVGLDARWANLLWLNFGFHNAHHDRPVEPWYRLPRLHRQLYGEGYGQVLPVRELLGAYHRHRVRRVLSDDYGVVLPAGQRDRAAGFIGAVGVSFLTAV